MKRARKSDPIALAHELLRALGQSAGHPANDAEPEIDEEAIRACARRDAEEMRRARSR